MFVEKQMIMGDRSKQSELLKDRVLGCMVGGAVGDALGYPVEFRSWNDIVNEYGEEGITRYRLANNGKALISDDTQMTLFTAAGLLLGMTRGYMRGIMGRPDTYCSYTYLDWLMTQKLTERPADDGMFTNGHTWLLDVPQLYSRRAPGNTCIMAIEAIKNGSEVKNDSCGCGGVMRTVPVALLCSIHQYAAGNKQYIDMMAAEAAKITHKHPLGFLPSAVLNHLIMDIMDGEIVGSDRLAHAARQAIDALPEIASEEDKGKTYHELWPKHVKRLQDIVMQAIDLAHTDIPDVKAIAQIGEGWTGHEALAISIYSAIKHADSFEDAVVSAVNHSGDSDSTGAICGNIMGCLLGRKSIPDYYTDKLELVDVIEEMATDLYTGCLISEYDYEDTPEKKKWYKKYILMRR